MTTIAVVPVRDGTLAIGGAEAVAECDGNAILIGDGTEAAARELTGIAVSPIATIERERFAPASWAQLLAPDAATIDLAEATLIVAGGAGLSGPERFRALARVAVAVNASVGGTRVVTDRGWLAHERQIGTTGVVVDPRVYVALGISGAVQHTSGLGRPQHIISVNTDPYCPMMQLADIAIVADANAVLEALARRLAVGETDPVATTHA